MFMKELEKNILFYIVKLIFMLAAHHLAFYIPRLFFSILSSFALVAASCYF